MTSGPGKRRLRLREVNGSLWEGPGCEQVSSGPWRLKVDLAAPKAAPKAFRKHHRVILEFPDAWPSKLPSIRFLGQLRSFYVKPPNEDKSDHVREASSKLLKRLQETAGANVSCTMSGPCCARIALLAFSKRTPFSLNL